jgi:predicted nucleotidyltransferase
MGVDVSELENKVFDAKKSFLRIPAVGIKAEFLPQVQGLTKFIEAFQRAKIFNLDGIQIPVIGYDDLIAVKRETNRPKDLADIDELEKRRKASEL